MSSHVHPALRSLIVDVGVERDGRDVPPARPSGNAVAVADGFCEVHVGKVIALGQSGHWLRSYLFIQLFSRKADRIGAHGVSLLSIPAWLVARNSRRIGPCTMNRNAGASG